MYLSEVPSGSTVRVKAIYGGVGALQRLRELGITEGKVLKVVHNPSIGPIIVEVDGSRVAIGRGLASKVEVEVVS